MTKAAVDVNLQVEKAEAYKRGYRAGLSRQRKTHGSDVVQNAYGRGYHAGQKRARKAIDRMRAELAASVKGAGPFDGELSVYRNGAWIMGINEPFIDAVLDAIRAALPGGFDAGDSHE